MLLGAGPKGVHSISAVRSGMAAPNPAELLFRAYMVVAFIACLLPTPNTHKMQIEMNTLPICE